MTSQMLSDISEPVIIVEDVSMMFNMASAQMNNLKEYFIAMAKGQLHFKKFMALENIDLVVKRGEQYGIVGTNGSGKSTLLKIIAGVLEPTTGRVGIAGNIAPLIELGAGFDMELTARENIYLNGERRRACRHCVRTQRIYRRLNQKVRQRKHHALNPRWQADSYNLEKFFPVDNQSVQMQFYNSVFA